MARTPVVSVPILLLLWVRWLQLRVISRDSISPFHRWLSRAKGFFRAFVRNRYTEPLSSCHDPGAGFNPCCIINGHQLDSFSAQADYLTANDSGTFGCINPAYFANYRLGSATLDQKALHALNVSDAFDRINMLSLFKILVEYCIHS
jgi:hypothetical protein